jgi:hypothetical protein
MKSAKLWLMAAAIIAIGAQPATSWATRAVGATVTGEITASPSATEIEVAHLRYHIEPNSPATQTARSFFLGQVVDLVLSRPGVNKDPEVVSIAAHVDQ